MLRSGGMTISLNFMTSPETSIKSQTLRMTFCGRTNGTEAIVVETGPPRLRSG
jgi:hypothetical protein